MLFRSENNNFFFVLRESDKLEGNISKVAKRMLYPRSSRIKTFLWMLEPKKLSLTLLGIRAGSDVVLAAVAI